MPPQPAVRLTSRQNPLVARFREAARHPRGSEGLVLVEGATLIDEARRAGWIVEVAAFTEQALDTAEAARLFDALPASAVRALVPGQVMDAMSPARTPSGAVALARGAVRSWQDVLAPGPALVVMAVDVQDPGNVGAIVRVAEAAGATGAVMAGAAADPFGWKALRGAMGSTFRLPVLRVPAVEAAFRVCRDHDLHVIATALDGRAFDEVQFARPCAILFGAEGSGLPPDIVDQADERLTIPMQEPLESLNVAVAAGIILYEARRQRRASAS